MLLRTPTKSTRRAKLHAQSCGRKGWSHASVRRASPLRLKRILFLPIEFYTQNRFSTQSVNRSVISLLTVTTPLSSVPRPTDAGCPVGAGGFLVRLLTRGEITSLTHVEWGTLQASGKSSVMTSAAMRSLAVRRANPGADRGPRCPGIMVRDGNGRLSTRMPQPAGRSTAARSWPSSGQEIRWRQCRGCACYTYHSDARPNLLKLSESLVGTTESFLGRSSGSIPNSLPSKLKLWTDSLQMHGQEKCLRSPGPSPL
jgi:hypothetical protein